MAGNIMALGPLAGILGQILGPKTDWKKILREQGEEAVREELRKRWKKKVEPKLEAMATKMKKDGFTWVNASTPAWVREKGIDLAEGEAELGPGFILVRDALYRVLKETGVPGGAVRDGWRDGADNAVFEGIGGIVTVNTTTKDVLRLTFEEFVRHTL